MNRSADFQIGTGWIRPRLPIGKSALLPPGSWWRVGLCRWLALLLSAVLWPGQPATAAEPVVTKEYQVKAAFLYNFTKFVEWPAEKFADAKAPIIIGVLGLNPCGAVLAETIKDRKVNGRGIQVRQISTVAEVRELHLLFITVAETNRFEGLEAALREGAVLGVGESEAFLTRGGTIRFALEDDKVRFEIDLNSAERAQLRVSAQLLKLARKVRKTP